MLKTGQISQIINGLTSVLMRSEKSRLLKRQIELVAKNRECSGGSFDGFFYQGKYYTDVDRALMSKGVKSGLHLSLVPEMEAHIKDVATVENDEKRIKQALSIVLRDCKTDQDLRDALPNQLADMIDQIKSLPRLRPEGFTVMGDPMKYKQYQTLREKIEFYSVTRLLY